MIWTFFCALLTTGLMLLVYSLFDYNGGELFTLYFPIIFHLIQWIVVANTKKDSAKKFLTYYNCIGCIALSLFGLCTKVVFICTIPTLIVTWKFLKSSYIFINETEVEKEQRVKEQAVVDYRDFGYYEGIDKYIKTHAVKSVKSLKKKSDEQKKAIIDSLAVLGLPPTAIDFPLICAHYQLAMAIYSPREAYRYRSIRKMYFDDRRYKIQKAYDLLKSELLVEERPKRKKKVKHEEYYI